jgi:hypothetical protein
MKDKENRMQGRIFSPGREDMTGDGQNNSKKTFMSCFFTQNYSGKM